MVTVTSRLAFTSYPAHVSHITTRQPHASITVLVLSPLSVCTCPTMHAIHMRTFRLLRSYTIYHINCVSISVIVLSSGSNTLSVTGY